MEKIQVTGRLPLQVNSQPPVFLSSYKSLCVGSLLYRQLSSTQMPSLKSPSAGPTTPLTQTHSSEGIQGSPKSTSKLGLSGISPTASTSAHGAWLGVLYNVLPPCLASDTSHSGRAAFPISPTMACQNKSFLQSPDGIPYSLISLPGAPRPSAHIVGPES